MLPTERSIRRRVSASLWWSAALLALLVGELGPAQAGGPVLVRPDGQPYRWAMAHPMRYVVSPGPFGSRTHAWALSMVHKAFGIWGAVPTARVKVVAAGELSQEVTAGNFLSFLEGQQPSDPSLILFDNDGSLFDTLLGKGASASWLGIGIPNIADVRSGRIYQSIAILNGALNGRFSDSFAFGSFIHELGHMLGLAHSQVNADELLDGDPDDDLLAAQMYYRGPNDPGGLSLDDQAWISWLYPNPDAAGSTGSIEGRVMLPDGVTGAQGIQVVARRVGDPRVSAVGVVSGFLFQNVPLLGVLGGGDPDLARMGEFLIPGLPPGSYTLEVEQLAHFPAMSVPVGYLVGGPKFWRQGSSAQDDPMASSLIEVSAGQAVTGVNIVLNGDSLGDPTPVAENTPNMLPDAQPVTLPVVISGQIEAPSGNAAGHDIRSLDDLQRVYSVDLDTPTVVTAILSASDPGAGLDLYVLGTSGGKNVIEASAVRDGTPPQVVQLRLPVGRHYFGVHQAGSVSAAYTLRLLATPAPDPSPAPDLTVITYLLIGDVTPTSAMAHWETTTDTPSVLYYNLPEREIGSAKREREHTLTMTELTPGSQTEVQVLAGASGNLDEADESTASLTSAVAPAAGGSPQLVATSSHLPLLDGLELVTVHLANTGTGDAVKVTIKQLTPASGWVFATEALLGARLPHTLDLGGIGAGGAGAFTAYLLRARGFATAKLTVHGTYTDASGNPMTF